MPGNAQAGLKIKKGLNRNSTPFIIQLSYEKPINAIQPPCQYFLSGKKPVSPVSNSQHWNDFLEAGIAFGLSGRRAFILR